MIEFKNVPFYVSGSDSAIGIIVIQEWWGLNDQIKRVCDRYAKSYSAMTITPDLYRGKVATKPDEANHLMSELNWPKAVDDVKIAAEFLISKGCKKVGIVGFCMGGALSLAAACLVNEIDAAAVFYGIPPKQLADPMGLKKPVQFHFGDKDESPGFSDVAAADALRDTIKSAGIVKVTEYRHENEEYHKIEDRKGDVAEFHRYATGNHAFMNEEAPAYPYDKNLADLANSHLGDFFNAYLS